MFGPNILSNSPSPSPDDWSQKFQSELKQDFENSLRWRMQGGLNISSYQSTININSKQLAFNQNSQLHATKWLNIPEFSLHSIKEINQQLATSPQKGLDGFICNLRKAKEFQSQEEINPGEHHLFFKSNNDAFQILNYVFESSNITSGGLANDPIANWMQGDAPYQETLDIICTNIEKSILHPNFYPLMVENHIYHQAGANTVLETALFLSAVVNYLDILTSKGISPGTALNAMFFSISVGPTYLTEIAKLRAIRILIKQIGLSYGIPFDDIHPFVQATNSQFHQTRIEENSNILRYSTEAMSAAIGGANAITITPHSIKESEKSLAETLASNCSLILAQESYLGHVADPLAGSYHIEELTEEIRVQSWQLFLEIEAKGGLLEYYNSGELRSRLDLSWFEKQEKLKDEVIIGVNKYKMEPTPNIKTTEPESPMIPSRNLADSYFINSIA
tara:strand:- start:102 stop:1448 length:1347 start_codon:yes stop_codon:yes gene_type:complete